MVQTYQQNKFIENLFCVPDEHQEVQEFIGAKFCRSADYIYLEYFLPKIHIIKKNFDCVIAYEFYTLHILTKSSQT